ncbi:hypothetical protein Tco_0194289 [Tanacetum coccineum]
MQEVKLIIWDEVPMNQRYDFKALDKTLRYILGYKSPKKGTTFLEIVSETYLDFTTRQTDDEYLKEIAILTPRNDDTDAVDEVTWKTFGGNKRELGSILGETRQDGNLACLRIEESRPVCGNDVWKACDAV